MGDWLDDLIGISKEFEDLKNSFTELSDDGTTSSRRAWTPSDYKAVPQVDASLCTRCIAEDEASCNRCIAACPKDCIHIADSDIEIDHTCIKCGVCIGVCPTHALRHAQFEPRKLYHDIAAQAQLHEQVYITCTRALGHVPHDAQIVLPCIGLLTPELWFALLVDYKNINVYLPLGKCDKCRTTTGDELLSHHIATGEHWANAELGLAATEEEMHLEVRRDVERKEFLKKAAKNAGMTAASVNPITKKIAKSYQRLQAHGQTLSRITLALERVSGSRSSAQRPRVLSAYRALMLTALKDHEELADRITVSLPKISQGLSLEVARLCADKCPHGALDVDETTTPPLVLYAAYCTGCALCADLCPNEITMQEKSAAMFFDLKSVDGARLLSVDTGDGKVSKTEAAAAKESLKQKAVGAKNVLNNIGDVLEKFDES